MKCHPKGSLGSRIINKNGPTSCQGTGEIDQADARTALRLQGRVRDASIKALPRISKSCDGLPAVLLLFDWEMVPKKYSRNWYFWNPTNATVAGVMFDVSLAERIKTSLGRTKVAGYNITWPQKPQNAQSKLPYQDLMLSKRPVISWPRSSFHGAEVPPETAITTLRAPPPLSSLGPFHRQPPSDALVPGKKPMNDTRQTRGKASNCDFYLTYTQVYTNKPNPLTQGN